MEEVSQQAPHLQLRAQSNSEFAYCDAKKKGHWSAKYERMYLNANEQFPLLWFWLQRSYMNEF